MIMLLGIIHHALLVYGDDVNVGISENVFRKLSIKANDTVLDSGLGDLASSEHGLEPNDQHSYTKDIVGNVDVLTMTLVHGDVDEGKLATVLNGAKGSQREQDHCVNAGNYKNKGIALIMSSSKDALHTIALNSETINDDVDAHDLTDMRKRIDIFDLDGIKSDCSVLCTDCIGAVGTVENGVMTSNAMSDNSHTYDADGNTHNKYTVNGGTHPTVYHFTENMSVEIDARSREYALCPDYAITRNSIAKDADCRGTVAGHIVHSNHTDVNHGDGLTDDVSTVKHGLINACTENNHAKGVGGDVTISTHRDCLATEYNAGDSALKYTNMQDHMQFGLHGGCAVVGTRLRCRKDLAPQHNETHNNSNVEYGNGDGQVRDVDHGDGMSHQHNHLHGNSPVLSTTRNRHVANIMP